jgi:hypothetical protein
MTQAMEFVKVVKEIGSKATPFVKGCLTGFLDAMAAAPSAAVVVHPVEGAQYKGKPVSGFVFSVVSSFEETKLPFEEISQRAITQRMIVMENDQAIEYLKYGEQQSIGSPYLQ